MRSRTLAPLAESVQLEYEGTFSDDTLEGTLIAGGGQFTAPFTGIRTTAKGEAR